MSTALAVRNEELLEKVILGNDLSGLSSMEKVQHVKNICDSIGLNPLTKPIQLMKFQGKEIPYVTKDGSEQLRKINNVSITDIAFTLVGDIYIVTAKASTPDGRTDVSTGAVNIKGLTGEALANAYLKTETKAKRRVTLSISGLGFLDENEVDSIAGAVKEPSQDQIHDMLAAIKDCLSMDELKNTYQLAYKAFKEFPNTLETITYAKDMRKEELMFSINNVAEIRDKANELLEDSSIEDGA